ncbi:MAG: hypothetical protein ACTHN0_00080 [Aquihabitans sp.]
MADLAIPERRWFDPTDSATAFFVIWLPAFVVIGFVALAVVMGQDPAGFDACDPNHPPPSGPERRVQALAASIAVLAWAGVALWRLRRGPLVVALLITGFGAFVWWWLIFGGSQTCAPAP